MQKGLAILGTRVRNFVRAKIKSDDLISRLCYDAVGKFNEFIGTLNGLKLVPVQPDDYFLAAELGKDYNLLPNDALHLAVMRRMQIANIATRDSDFERADEVLVWSQ